MSVGHYPVRVLVEVQDGDAVTFEAQNRCGCTESLDNDYPHAD